MSGIEWDLIEFYGIVQCSAVQYNALNPRFTYADWRESFGARKWVICT